MNQCFPQCVCGKDTFELRNSAPADDFAAAEPSP